MPRIHAYYSGDVQGVGFRFTAQELARLYGIKGWVKNAPDGKVEMLAEAEGPVLQNFLTDLQGRMAHYITNTESFQEPAAEVLSGFQIRY